MSETEERGAQAPRSISDLLLLRTDYEDVPVEALGGEVLRVYALSGTARGILVPDLAEVAAHTDEKSPEAVRAVFLFQTRVVAASIGYPEEEWNAFGALGSAAIEALYAVAARLSGLDGKAKAEAVQRLPAKRNAASGTASPSR